MEKNVTAIFAHIDHGKTTVVDSFLASKGYIPSTMAGEMRYLDTRKDEQRRGITLKNSFIEIDNHFYIDTPGHVDFEGLIYSASLMADNFLLIVDVTEGITPRTYSLIKFIKKNRTVLILNKIDKFIEAVEIQAIIYSINNIIGESLFEWDKNNIILCSAKLCGAINHDLFKFSKSNTLKSANKAFQVLSKKIDSNVDIEAIKKKFKIKLITKKEVFSKVFPLYKSVLNSLNHLDNELKLIDELKSCKIESKNNDLVEESEKKKGLSIELDEKISTTSKLEDDNPLDLNGENKGNSQDVILGITHYCILKEKNLFCLNNLLFITKVYSRALFVGDIVYSNGKEKTEKVKIENIYIFKGEEIIKSNVARPYTLCCLKGNFLKDSILSIDPIDIKDDKLFDLGYHHLSPLYVAKIILSDSTQICKNFKNVFNTMSYTEHSLKVRRNRLSEFEIKCSGEVQFEKISEDLLNSGFDFKKSSNCLKFAEYPTKVAEINFLSDECEFYVKIEPSETVELEIPEENGIIKSVISVFLRKGHLINEKIINLKITVKLISSESSLSLFNSFKQKIIEVYKSSEPSIVPLYYNLKICLTSEYIGIVYSILSNNNYLMGDEILNESTELYTITCKIPQFNFNTFIENIRIQCRGTVYLESDEDDFIIENDDFSGFIDVILKEKGLFKTEKIVEEPEKQRNLKK